jgi:hypothetical protein
VPARCRPATFHMTRRLTQLTAGFFGFSLLVLLNCGGYRYGVGDQAFQVPAVAQHLDPALFPRDRMLLQAQSALMMFDDGAAAIVRLTGLSIPVLFAAGYLAWLLLLFGGLVLLGRSCFQSWWATSALILVMTLRHRITQTGVNSLEGCLLPRTLAFAVGIWAVGAFLRGRGIWALALVGVAAALHPTTGVWFGIWIAVGLLVSEQRWRGPILAVATIAIAGVGWAMWAGPLSGRFVVMDSRWTSALSGKDYLFPSSWGASFWLVNFGYLAVILGVHQYRRVRRIQFPREAGLVCGAAVLAGTFLLSLPAVAGNMALAIQLQVSRVFWMLDLLAAVYLVWLAVEASGPRAVRLQIRRAAVVFIALVASMRGIYVMRAEGAGAPLVRVELPRDDWTDVMAWIARTPPSAHVLADPGHAWKYGSSVRVAGQRDVYLEEVKDAAIAVYSRQVADRFVQRVTDLGDFGQLTPEKARWLAQRYDLDYLVTDQPMRLTAAYRNRRFTVYSLAAVAVNGR